MLYQKDTLSSECKMTQGAETGPGWFQSDIHSMRPILNIDLRYLYKIWVSYKEVLRFLSWLLCSLHNWNNDKNYNANIHHSRKLPSSTAADICWPLFGDKSPFNGSNELAKFINIIISFCKTPWISRIVFIEVTFEHCQCTPLRLKSTGCHKKRDCYLSLKDTKCIDIDTDTDTCVSLTCQSNPLQSQFHGKWQWKPGLCPIHEHSYGQGLNLLPLQSLVKVAEVGPWLFQRSSPRR